SAVRPPPYRSRCARVRAAPRTGHRHGRLSGTVLRLHRGGVASTGRQCHGSRLRRVRRTSGSWSAAQRTPVACSRFWLQAERPYFITVLAHSQGEYAVALHSVSTVERPSTAFTDAVRRNSLHAKPGLIA